MYLQERMDLLKVLTNVEKSKHVKRGEPYFVQRQISSDGTIVWFGIETNWKKEPNKGWTVLGTDFSVEPIDPINEPCVFPEGRTKFFDCEEPTYETLYQKMLKEGER